ncbi:G patch domain-containing protein 1 homolog [Eurosta solidaginis]|uniref:G patch domain-containing protein 1 homolog n=1 Tax=Eurosta solidaginis TaxID=178769 RepID=UPI00353104C5
MYDEASFHRFGTTLPELDEETIPAKKPIRIEDQIVTDENGKRRFHGAFTGGFSAGYWNTVGSQEGWTPATFKSSRSEKTAQLLQQRPDDFMDDEDRGEFGIAPQRLQTRSEYATFEPEPSRKRKLMIPSVGPIPGQPVLEQLFTPRDLKIGERILKSMGWRVGQGIGPRQTRKEKQIARARNRREMYVMQQYGYQPNTPIPQSPGHSDDADGEVESSDEEMDKLTFAPDDYEPYVCAAKKDRFGLGYKGSLSRDPVLSAASSRHINLFEPSVEALGKNNKKISFNGQAFGVGALEEEDDDIYAKDDMSRYDFSLEDNKPKKKKIIREQQNQLIVAGFSACKMPAQIKKPENPTIPSDFVPRNWAERRSRFQPIDPKKAEELETYFKEVEFSKNRLNPDERAELLGEAKRIDEPPTASTGNLDLHAQQQQNNQKLHSSQQATPQIRVTGGDNKLPEKARLMMKCVEQEDRFTCGEYNKTHETHNTSDACNDMMKHVHERSKQFNSMPSMFKPFLHDDQKQGRYEEFLLAELKTEEEITRFLNRIQPIHLSEWDREMEKKEFIQASKIFRPLEGLMSQRFVSESSIKAECTPAIQSETPSGTAPKKIKIERSKTIWKPSSLLCKRYNIAEPFGAHMEGEKCPPASTKMSVFDYLEDCVHKKSDFKTPVIVPVRIPEIKPILKQPNCKMANDKKDISNVSTCSVSTMTSPLPSSSSSSATSIVVVDHVKRKHSSPSRSKENTSKVGRSAAKTDLEKLSEESLTKPACEKLELYKAIFDDSSDEDGVEQYEVTVISKEGENDCVLKKEKVSDGPLEKKLSVCSSFSADQINVLRNTSPPRGIFSALLSTKTESKQEGQHHTQKYTTAKESESITRTEVDIDCDIYDLCDIEKYKNRPPNTSVSHAGLIPSSAESVKEIKIEFKQPASTSSSKTTMNSASTTSSKSLRNQESNEIEIEITGEYRKEKQPMPKEKHKDNKRIEKNVKFNRLRGAGCPSVSSDLPSTSSGVREAETYGPALPQYICKPTTAPTTVTTATPTVTDTTKITEMNKIVEEKMIRFLVQRARSPGYVRDEEWVEKKVRKILKTKTLSTSSSSSSSSVYENNDSLERRQRLRKKKSKKNKSHKKSKKRSKDKKTKKSKKKKGKH